MIGGSDGWHLVHSHKQHSLPVERDSSLVGLYGMSLSFGSVSWFCDNNQQQTTHSLLGSMEYNIDSVMGCHPNDKQPPPPSRQNWIVLSLTHWRLGRFSGCFFLFSTTLVVVVVVLVCWNQFIEVIPSILFSPPFSTSVRVSTRFMPVGVRVTSYYCFYRWRRTLFHVIYRYISNVAVEFYLFARPFQTDFLTRMSTERFFRTYERPT